MKRRERPAPAYKARLAQRRESLELRQQLQADFDARMHFMRLIDSQLESLRTRKAALDAAVPPLSPIKPARAASFFERLIAAAIHTTDHLAQDFAPKKGPGDARFFAQSSRRF